MQRLFFCFLLLSPVFGYADLVKTTLSVETPSSEASGPSTTTPPSSADVETNTEANAVTRTEPHAQTTSNQNGETAISELNSLSVSDSTAHANQAALDDTEQKAETDNHEAVTTDANSSSTDQAVQQEITQKSIQQLNLLFNNTYQKAESELIKSGTFTPFGAIVSTSGKINFIQVNNEIGAEPERTVSAIQSAMINLAKEQKIFACAVYYITSGLPTVDGVFEKAIVGKLEHASGLALAIATEVNVINGVVSYSPPVTSEIPSDVFYWAYQTKVGKSE